MKKKLPLKLYIRGIKSMEIKEYGCEQERINVELYFEKLLDLKGEYPYGSDERRKIIHEGIVLLRELIDSAYKRGMNKGKILQSNEVKKMLLKEVKEIDENIIMETLKDDNESETQKTFVELLNNYGKDEGEI